MFNILYLLNFSILVLCSGAASNYIFESGYISTCNSSIHDYRFQTESYSTYPCTNDDMITKLLSEHIVNVNDMHTFNATKFLTLLQNKKLVIVGDSVALQMFHALDIELKCEETYLYNGNGTQNWFWFAPKWKSKIYGAHYNAAIRKYKKYNTEIIWCGDNEMTLITHQTQYEFCGKLALQSDYIIIGQGAFYKPLYRNTNYSNYYIDMAYRSLDFAQDIYKFRKDIKEINSKIEIIWRDFPHVGNHDELVYLGGLQSKKHLPHNKKDHKNGLLWGVKKHEAPWIQIINSYIRNIAKEYGDYFLEYNALSHTVLDYFNKHQLRGHDDAIHWCAGGLHRYGNLLIQDKLSEIYDGLKQSEQSVNI